MNSCNTCKFMFLDGEWSRCRRYPESIGVSKDYWCGEFSLAGVGNSSPANIGVKHFNKIKAIMKAKQVPMLAAEIYQELRLKHNIILNHPRRTMHQLANKGLVFNTGVKYHL